MPNPLYTQQQNPFSEIMQQAQELRKSLNGNPRDIVYGLLNSGQMSQADFNRYAQIAMQITGSIPR